jgi:hypothetical protein
MILLSPTYRRYAVLHDLVIRLYDISDGSNGYLYRRLYRYI